MSKRQVTHPVDIVVASQIRDLRMRRGLSMKALADAVGITFQQLQKYETATDRITAGRLMDIAGVLGVRVAELFDDRRKPAGRSRAYPASEVEALIIAKLRSVRSATVKRRLLELVMALPRSER